MFVAIAAMTPFVTGSAMLFKTAQLRSGGSKVALLLGGEPVSMDTTDPKEHRWHRPDGNRANRRTGAGTASLLGLPLRNAPSAHHPGRGQTNTSTRNTRRSSSAHG